MKEQEEQQEKWEDRDKKMWEWENYGKWGTEWNKNKKENGKIGTHEEKNEIPIRT